MTMIRQDLLESEEFVYSPQSLLFMGHSPYLVSVNTMTFEPIDQEMPAPQGTIVTQTPSNSIATSRVTGFMMEYALVQSPSGVIHLTASTPDGIQGTGTICGHSISEGWNREVSPTLESRFCGNCRLGIREVFFRSLSREGVKSALALLEEIVSGKKPMSVSIAEEQRDMSENETRTAFLVGIDTGGADVAINAFITSQGGLGLEVIGGDMELGLEELQDGVGPSLHRMIVGKEELASKGIEVSLQKPKMFLQCERETQTFSRPTFADWVLDALAVQIEATSEFAALAENELARWEDDWMLLLENAIKSFPSNETERFPDDEGSSTLKEWCLKVLPIVLRELRT